MEVDTVLEEVFFRGSKRVFLTGVGGCGKTTILIKLAKDWAAGKKTFEHFDCVVFVDLAEIAAKEGDETVTIQTLLKFCGVDSTQRFLQWSRNHKVLYMLDGWDERKANISEAATQYFMIGSRPEDIPENNRTWTVVNVQGLTSQGVLSFLRRTFQTWNRKEQLEAAKTVWLCCFRMGGVWKTISSLMATAVLEMDVDELPEPAAEMQKLTTKEKWLRDMMRLPLMLEIFCTCQGATLTEKYKELTDRVLERSVAKYGLSSNARSLLRKYAYKSFVGSFDIDAKISTCRDVVKSGFVANEMFVHFSFLHYFAAEYACLEDSETDVGEDLSLIRRYRTKGEVFFRFCCGIGGNVLSVLLKFVYEGEITIKHVGPFGWISEDRSNVLKEFLLDTMNVLDKNACSELMIACAEKGYYEVKKTKKWHIS